MTSKLDDAKPAFWFAVIGLGLFVIVGLLFIEDPKPEHPIEKAMKHTQPTCVWYNDDLKFTCTWKF